MNNIECNYFSLALFESGSLFRMLSLEWLWIICYVLTVHPAVAPTVAEFVDS